MLGDGFDGGFAGVVSRVAGRVGDALFAAGDDDGFLRAGGVVFEVGEEGVDAVYYAEEIWGRCMISLEDGGSVLETRANVLTSIIWWKTPLLVQSPFGPIPALRWRKSSDSTFDFSLFQSEREATSIECVSTLPAFVEESMDLASSSFEVLLSTSIRFIPCEAHSLATARPTPDAPPVIKAFAPFRKTEMGDAIVFLQA